MRASTRGSFAASQLRAASQGRSARTRGRSRAVCMASADEAQVVVCGGGIVAASIAYHLTLRGVKPLVVERLEVAAAASGKAGGFLARGWGDGGPTQALHRVSFDMHEQLAATLGVSSYRRIPTLSVRTAPDGKSSAMSEPPAPWLDGRDVVAAQDMGGQTAQVTPLELTRKLMDAAVANGATLRRGVVDGIDTEAAADGSRVATAVRVDGEPVRCRQVVVAMGPWSVLAEDWLGVACVPLEGIKSASVVYNSEAVRKAVSAAPYALFCNEDSRYGTHLEVYPRNNGEIYVCGAPLGAARHLGDGAGVAATPVRAILRLACVAR
jgi:glycine/D-amino acid oxidase-like deaminating enzyme